MSKKSAIKIVKRDERSGAAKARIASAKKQPDPTRKMIETVSGWVRDFKRQRDAGSADILSA